MDAPDAVGSSSLCEDSVPHRPPGSDQLNNGLPQSRESIQEKDDMQKRLQTFVNWIGRVLPIQLSIAGFVFVGPLDRVECETCKLIVGNWTKDDIPLNVHRKYSPDCKFLQKWFPVTKLSESRSSESSVMGYDASRAKYQAFVMFAKRLATFDAWPLKLDLHSPTNMSLAGFLYIGSADRARCFYCGLTLRDWDTDDDPFAAHLQWSPKCDYILHIQDEKAKTGTKGVLEKLKVDENFNAQSSTANVKIKRSTFDNSVTGNSMAPSCQQWKHSTQVETVLAMGFSEELIQVAISRKLETTGVDFPDAVSLFCAVEDIAESKH